MARIGVIHYNFPMFTFEQFLDYCPGAGFEYVEVQIGDLWSGDAADAEAEAAKVRSQLDARGLRASALSAGNDFVVLDPTEVDAQVARMERVIGLAMVLGASVVRTEGGSPKESVPEDRWVEAMAGCLKRIAPAAEASNVRLAIDNHGWCTNDGDRQLAVLEAVGSSHVGVNLDTMNYRWFGHDIPTINRYYALLARHTFHTHLKDGFGSRENYRGAVLGEGEIDLACAVKCLKDAGYDGVYCAEYEGPPPSDEGYRRCGEWMRANL